MPYRTLVFLILLLAVPAHAGAQTYTFGADLLFFGDNTEFANPFRSGETTLGVSGQIFVDVSLNDAVTLRGGLFGLGRFGAHEFLDHAEPAIALEIARGPSRFVFGSLRTITTRQDVVGPDDETLHRLLPPLQQETLTFTRGQEMGLQWLVTADRLDQDAWINWQRLNTGDHRERFDAGYRASLGLAGPLRLHGQWHVVHEGGQQFDSGAVRDSQAAALGLGWSARTGASRVTLDAHAVLTEEVSDRQWPVNNVGIGAFSRASVERGPWRSHLIVWRGRDVLKAEGDANYLSRRGDGTIFPRVRDYAELGLTRHFRPAPGVHMVAAFRIHRTESHYEYSYRIVARVRLRHGLTARGESPGEHRERRGAPAGAPAARTVRGGVGRGIAARMPAGLSPRAVKLGPCASRRWPPQASARRSAPSRPTSRD
ncbi:MAG TPA: hypothetical protein VMO26_24140 [Vicinamibacterales bacterium]|nr:hypothetical protein [Vicinamibacterales bacterium]